MQQLREMSGGIASLARLPGNCQATGYVLLQRVTHLQQLSQCRRVAAITGQGCVLQLGEGTDGCGIQSLCAGYVTKGAVSAREESISIM